MFFILSKIFSFLLAPIIWIFFISIIGIFTKNIKKQKRRFLTAILLLFFFSNGFFLSVIKLTITTKAVKIENLQRKYDVGIVLGGFSGYDEDFDRLNFYKSSDRLWQALNLYNKKIIEKILISGGSGKLINNKYKEANFVKEYLLNLGIPEKDILIDNKSQNTYQNAINSAKILNSNSKYILITSSLHMLRAKKCFKKAGLDVDVFPTNYNSISKLSFKDYAIPSSGVLFAWNEFLHELAGITTYKLTGKI